VRDEYAYRPGFAYGATPGDTFHCGMRSNSESLIRGNTQPMDRRLPSQHERYVLIIAKARRDIEIHRKHIDDMEETRIRRDEFTASVQEVLENPELITILKKGFKQWLQVMT